MISLWLKTRRLRYNFQTQNASKIDMMIGADTFYHSLEENCPPFTPIASTEKVWKFANRKMRQSVDHNTAIWKNWTKELTLIPRPIHP